MGSNSPRNFVLIGQNQTEFSKFPSVLPKTPAPRSNPSDCIKKSRPRAGSAVGQALEKLIGWIVTSCPRGEDCLSEASSAATGQLVTVRPAMFLQPPVVSLVPFLSIQKSTRYGRRSLRRKVTRLMECAQRFE